jgi:hypothetical protein
MSDWVDRLMRIARGVLREQQQKISQMVIARVEDEIIGMMRSYVNEVVGGVWIGRGADAFVAAIENEAMPMASEVVGHCTDLNTNLARSEQIMDEADARVRGMMNNLADTFNNVY